MSAPTPEKLAELRRLLDATETPWALWDGYGPDGNGDMRVARIGHLSGSGIRADPDSADIYGMREAFELLASAVNALPALLDAAAERDALRTWQERVALAAGLADEVAGYGVHLEADPDTAAEHVAGLLDIADTHAECPIYCGDCGEPLADTPCDHCGGSGCGPGTGSWAYEECGWCAGAGKVHVGCAHLSYAELCAERDALAAKLDAVRALHGPRVVQVLGATCSAEECDHEDACPLVDYTVCGHCYDVGDGAHPCAYEEGGLQDVAHPCATRRALDATPDTGGES